MEAILFIGIQATGKTSFYTEKFLNTHVRISLDLLNTRNKEQKFFDLCLELQQRFVIDNTNPTQADRLRYITAAKDRKFKVIGYYFESKISDAKGRNAARAGKARVPDAGLHGTYSKLEMPTFAEGFDELYFVSIEENGFAVKEWQDEI